MPGSSEKLEDPMAGRSVLVAGATGGRGYPHACDAAIQAAIEHAGKLDVVVNAGAVGCPSRTGPRSASGRQRAGPRAVCARRTGARRGRAGTSVAELADAPLAALLA